MFDQVCNVVLQEKIKAGLKIPSDPSERMKLLSKAWGIRPMSYKQFSNMVEGKNSFYEELVKRNGKEDPLQKTLLIIDEAHKLYGGTDLSAQERPNMDKFHKALMNSYEKSGKDSVRLLMMTGTPITNDPMELIKLINLTKLQDKQIPDTFEEFAKIYLDEDGKFTNKGKWKYLNDISGTVSYLNRERDARQFSQPVVTPVFVPLSENNTSSLRSELVKKEHDKKDMKESEEFVKQRFAEYKEDIKTKCRNKDFTKVEKQECEKHLKEETKEVNKDLKDELQKLKERGDKLTKDIRAMKTELKKEDPSQYGLLMQKCLRAGLRPRTTKP